VLDGSGVEWCDGYGNVPAYYIADEIDGAIDEVDADYQALLITTKQSRD
jgi:hypothetical protein